MIKKLATGMLGGALATLAMSAINAQIEAQRPVLRSVLAGEGHEYQSPYGRIFYQVHGPADGLPLLLLHGIYAAPSGWEMRKLHHGLSQTYRVYTPDLLGFGLSERPASPPSPELYTSLILDFVTQQIGRRPAIIASTLTCSYVIAAAARQPELFGPLVLIEPVGITQLATNPGPVGDLAYQLLTAPILGPFLFHLLTSRASLRWFLQQDGYLDPAAITPEVIEANYAASHQPNAHYAPAAFIAGKLNRNIRADFARLTQPILLAWGYQARTVPVQNATLFLQTNPRAEIIGFDAAGLPHDESAKSFIPEISHWLAHYHPPAEAATPTWELPSRQAADLTLRQVDEKRATPSSQAGPV